MSRNGTTLALIVSALVLGVTGVASAQTTEPEAATSSTSSDAPAADVPDEEESDDTFTSTDTTVEEDNRSFNQGRPIVEAHHYPLRYIDRPLNLHKKMIRLDANLDVLGLAATSDVGVREGVGAAIALSNSFEMGLSSYRLNGYDWVTNNPGGAGAFPYAFKPNGQFGDVAIYGRYRIVNTSDFAFSFDLAVLIPTHSSSNWHLHVAAPIRARLARRFNIDAGFEIDLSFSEQGTSMGMPVEETQLYLYLPVAGVLQLTDQLFLAGRSGLFLPRGAFDEFYMPLTFDLGYTVAKRDRAPVLDVVATFGWPQLLVPGSNTDTVRGDLWIARLGLNGYFQL